MPIPDVSQPNFIQINVDLRLRAYDGKYETTLPWYEDDETGYHVFRGKVRRSLEELFSLYQESCEVYFIELRKDHSFLPVGFVAFNQWCMPLVIAPSHRNRHLGRQVVQTLISRGRQLGYDEMMLQRIYDDNPAALKCFTAGGFKVYAITSDSSLLHVML